MSRLSDAIEAMINQMLDENEGVIEFSRSALAEQMNCVPSQITYVLSTRFNGRMGYIRESRRGGGGSITIQRVRFDSPESHLSFQLQELPASLTQQQAQVLIVTLLERGAIDGRIAHLLKTAVSQQSLRAVPADRIGQVRADLLENLLIALEAGGEWTD